MSVMGTKGAEFIHLLPFAIPAAADLGLLLTLTLDISEL